MALRNPLLVYICQSGGCRSQFLLARWEVTALVRGVVVAVGRLLVAVDDTTEVRCRATVNLSSV